MPSVFICLKENYLSKFAEAWWNDFQVSVARKFNGLLNYKNMTCSI